MPAFLNISGTRFGKLVAIKPIGKQCGHTVWSLQCDCGRIATVSLGNLRTGDILSCGCLKESLKGANSPMFKHGYTRTPTYNTWCAMKHRCTKKTDKCWDIYGGRGISVCERWAGRRGFKNFI